MRTSDEIDEAEVRTSDCLACGEEADGYLICLRCDIREDEKARRRDDR